MNTSEWQGRMERLLTAYDPFKNFELFEGLVTESDPITTYEDFQRWFSLFSNGGCFRGQSDATWQLVATLDRKLWQEIEVKTPDVESTSNRRLNALENEKNLLLDFQRGAHNYQENTPPIDYTVDWLAMMQHYGAPTRLLDWTRSPYVALYFALQGDSSSDSALWAIDLNWLRERCDALLRIHHKDFPPDPDFDVRYKYINGVVVSDKNRYPIIVPVAPRQLNERMTVQQGELLYNLNGIAFSTSLLGMLIQPERVERQVVSRVILKRGRRIKILQELRRMNIHDASLFPGLDGFARSLGMNLDISLAEQVEAEKKAVAEAMRGYRARRALANASE